MARTTLSLTIGAVSLLACTAEKPREAGQWPISKAELHAPADARGEITYRRYCISCHGGDGRGNGGVTGLDFVGSAAGLAGRADGELETSVREGKRGARAVMPSHKPVLSDAQISDAVAYVRARYIAPNAAIATKDGTAADGVDAGSSAN
jgi:mono/diheme cytochrome c family protein